MLEREGMLLNLNDASLSYKGEKISLTKNEFRILQMLMENAGMEGRIKTKKGIGYYLDR